MTITRNMLERAFPNDIRLQRAFEDQARVVSESESSISTTAEATTALQDATVITLSSNAALNNERVLKLGAGLAAQDVDGELRLDTSTGTPKVVGGYTVNFTVSGDTALLLPLSGRVATTQNTETFENKTLDAPILTGLGDFADDTAAASGGVPVGGIYRAGSDLKVRVA